MEALPEELDDLADPVYGPYAYARALLGPDSRVLDVGCGNGKVSAYLARTGAIVDGVEPSSTRSREARGRVRHLSTVPVGEEDAGLLPEYDLITFFDVLEHLAEPAPALDWAVDRLASGGRVLASIPNSAHYSFRRKILRGDWTMQDWGLFDRTHLRFYDPKTMLDLRPDGLALERSAYFAPDATHGWRLSVLRRWPALFALHVVLVWQKAP